MSLKIKHGWNTWENYLKVHESTDQFYSLNLENLEIMSIKQKSILIDVKKIVEINPTSRRLTAKTYEYHYHARFKENGLGIIRYCSPHSNHNKFHHKHIYDSFGKIKQTIRVAQDSWPHVSEFFDEVINGY